MATVTENYYSYGGQWKTATEGYASYNGEWVPWATAPVSTNTIALTYATAGVAQVRDLNARWVVAGVQNIKVGWADVMFHHDSMGEHGFLDASESDAAVPVGITSAREDEAIPLSCGHGDNSVVGGDSVGRFAADWRVHVLPSAIPLVVGHTEALAVRGSVASGAGSVDHGERI